MFVHLLSDRSTKPFFFFFWIDIIVNRAVMADDWLEDFSKACMRYTYHICTICK